MTRPATRYGREVVFVGGHALVLSRWQRLLFALGVRKSINPAPERRSL